MTRARPSRALTDGTSPWLWARGQATAAAHIAPRSVRLPGDQPGGPGLHMYGCSRYGICFGIRVHCCAGSGAGLDEAPSPGRPHFDEPIGRPALRRGRRQEDTRAIHYRRHRLGPGRGAEVPVSFVKRELERQQELGFSLTCPDDPVCSKCIEDVALRQFVSGHAQIDECGFCGESGPHGLSLGGLFEYMSGCLHDDYDDPLNEVAWDGGWASANVFDSDELLARLDEPLGHPRLRDAFVSAFDREWCQANPHGLPYHEQLSYSWENFAQYVQERGRYLFLRTGRREDGQDPDLFEPARVLDEVAKTVHNGDVTRTLPAASQLVRARAHPKEEFPSSPRELGSPPMHVTVANRMSPAGISMFYGAHDVDTALAEVRPRTGEWVTVAGWRTSRDIRYLDLADLPVVPSVFDQFARSRRPWVKFLRRFAVEIARPVSSDAGPVEYVPTQIFTEFLRDEVLDHDGNRIEAIRYPSAVRHGGMCWVLFVDPTGCGDHDGALLTLDASRIERFEPWWRPLQDASESLSQGIVARNDRSSE
jgi:hypothetical protein